MKKYNNGLFSLATGALLLCGGAVPAAAAEAETILSGVPATDAAMTDFVVENNSGSEQWALKTMPAWSVGNAEEFKYFHLESAYIEDWNSTHDDWIFIPVTLPSGRVTLDLDFEYLTSADSGTGFNIKACYGSSASSDAMVSVLGDEENCKSPSYLWFNKAKFSAGATVDGGSGFLGLHVSGQLRRDDWINILSINLTATEAEGEAAIGDIAADGRLNVVSQSNSLVISGASGETVSIYTVDGHLVKRFAATGTHEIALQKGIYIVKTRTQSIKAAIN